MRKLIAIALLLLPLVGCGEGELDYLKLSPIGGGGSAPAPAPAQPARGYNGQPLAPGASKMLEDPEAQTDEWEHDTFAESQGEAEARCEQRAAEMTRNGGYLVRSVGAKQVKGKLFKCQLVSEVPDRDR